MKVISECVLCECSEGSNTECASCLKQNNNSTTRPVARGGVGFFKLATMRRISGEFAFKN
jgi:hypothetical protein